MPFCNAIRATFKDILTLPKGSSTSDFLKVPHGTTVQDFLTISYSPSNITIRESNTLMPETETKVNKEDLKSLIVKGEPVTNILSKLLPLPQSNYTELNVRHDILLQTFRANYAAQPGSLVKLHPQARETLKALKERGIPVAICSAQTPLSAVFDLMDRHGLSDFVWGDLIIGDEEWRLTGNDSAACAYEGILVPRVRNTYDNWIKREGDILAVRRTGHEEDNRFAERIGARATLLLDFLAVVDEEEESRAGDRL
ncbi:HAD family hydrolase [Aspergillus undulatus]|uniref:HAD family hydrolase n=1 Tax=Aspergillus undulatus TaxID=1810928 RepID=UPI003CCD272B